MPIFGLTTLLAIIAIVHAIKTGRNQLWISALLFLPGVGVIAYLIVEVLPELLGGRTGRTATRAVGNVINPNKSLEEAKREYKISATARNAVELADIHCEKGQYAEASKLYEEALIGLNEHNPDTMHKLATAEFELNNYDKTKSLLDTLIEKNPDYKNQDAHLLYARTQEALGNHEAATEEYETLIKYYTGPEPHYRYGVMMENLNNHDRAQELFKSVKDKADLSPKHYRSMHKEWISKSRARIQ